MGREYTSIRLGNRSRGNGRMMSSKVEKGLLLYMKKIHNITHVTSSSSNREENFFFFYRSS
jgi:hypothetical protein